MSHKPEHGITSDHHGHYVVDGLHVGLAFGETALIHLNTPGGLGKLRAKNLINQAVTVHVQYQADDGTVEDLTGAVIIEPHQFRIWEGTELQHDKLKLVVDGGSSIEKVVQFDW
jgi:hypothetical protein